jgi:hypothetical protein
MAVPCLPTVGGVSAVQSLGLVPGRCARGQLRYATNNHGGRRRTGWLSRMKESSKLVVILEFGSVRFDVKLNFHHEVAFFF